MHNNKIITMFFDLNIQGSSLENNIELAKQAALYGWQHINFSYNQNDFKNALSLKNDLKDSLDSIIDFDYTLEIKSTSIKPEKRFERKSRGNY